MRNMQWMRKYSIRRHPHMARMAWVRIGWNHVPLANPKKRALSEKVARWCREKNGIIT